MGQTPDLIERIDDLCAQASRADATTSMIPALEDLLAEGYVEALGRDAHSRRLARRLEALVETLDAPGAATEARQLARERRQVDLSARELRRRLDVMREHFVRLGGGSSLPTP